MFYLIHKCVKCCVVILYQVRASFFALVAVQTLLLHVFI